jgi:hypothetical protein
LEKIARYAETFAKLQDVKNCGMPFRYLLFWWAKGEGGWKTMRHSNKLPSIPSEEPPKSVHSLGSIESSILYIVSVEYK